MMELIERVVMSIERIAAALEQLAVKGVTTAAGTQAAGTNIKSSPQNNEAMVVDYDALVAAGNRDALLALCEKRSIDVPKGTKTPTLANKLRTWDAANPQGTAETEETEEVSGDQGAPQEINPFGDDDAQVDAKITIMQVREALQGVLSAEGKGNPAVLKILQEQGGVDYLKDLTEDKFQAVYEEAIK